MRAPSLSRFTTCLLAIVVLLSAGCQQTPLLDRTVDASSQHGFAAWQRENRGAFTNDDWAAFEQALQDIKVKIIANKEATGSEAVNDGLRPKVNGLTVRAVLQQGNEARLWRLNVEKTTLEELLKANEQLITVASPERGAEVRRQGESHAARLKRAVEEIRAVEARQKALSAPAAK